MSRPSNITSKYHSAPLWGRRGELDRDTGFERRFSSSAGCSRSRSRSRSTSPRETSSSIVLGDRLSVLGSSRRLLGACLSPYSRSLEHNRRTVLTSPGPLPRTLPEVLHSTISPEPLDFFEDNPSAAVANELPECDVVELGRHILTQSYTTVDDVRSFVDELPIESAHVDMASLIETIQTVDMTNGADLVSPLVGLAALMNTVISANEELREEVTRLRDTVTSLTLSQRRSPPRDFHYTSSHMGSGRLLLSSRNERRLVYNPLRISNRVFPVPCDRGIPAREDLGMYISELSGDGEFIKDKNIITCIQKISRYIIFRMIPPELYNSFSVRTRERGVTYIDFPQVYLKALSDLHVACCGLQSGDKENEHYIVSASDCAVKTALNDLRRKPPKISVKAKMRNEQEYGKIFEENDLVGEFPEQVQSSQGHQATGEHVK